MKKSLFLLLLLLPLLAVPAFAQESRQDMSISGTALMPPYASGNSVQLSATTGFGALVSYRYMLTPHGSLEVNYQYAQNVEHFLFPGGSYNINTRFQEFSGAYVRSFIYKNFNPFLELGPGAFMFAPADTAKTQTFGINRSTAIGLVYGGGIAYEISPSFDIRVEYRGLVMKTPDYNYPNNDLRTDTYYNVNDPVIGIAYHF